MSLIFFNLGIFGCRVQLDYSASPPALFPCGFFLFKPILLYDFIRVSWFSEPVTDKDTYKVSTNYL